jgi:hypothetical protein
MYVCPCSANSTVVAESDHQQPFVVVQWISYINSGRDHNWNSEHNYTTNAVNIEKLVHANE